MRERGRETEGAVLWSMIAEMPSGPGAIFVGEFRIRSKTISGVHKSGEGREEGGGGG